MEIKTFKEGISAASLIEDRFKSSLFSIRFLLPLQKETITEYALSMSVITETCAKFKTASEVERRLSELYGAEIYFDSSKLGDNFLITVTLSGLDDKYGIGSERPFSDAADLLHNMIFNPDVTDGELNHLEVKKKKASYIDKIKSEINDKRTLAKKEMLSIMFEDEPYGISAAGCIEDVENATPESLYNSYKSVIDTAYIRMSFIGASSPEAIFKKFADSFSDTQKRYKFADVEPPKIPQKIKEVTKRMDVAQGKLVMGFRTAKNGDDRNTYAITVASDIFGGGTYSKLFSIVREKLSLCYYCSARPSRYKGLITVESGISDENAQKAKEAILEQLKAVQTGDFSDDLIASSKKSMRESLKAVNDNPMAIDSWYGLRMVSDNPITPEEFLKLIESLTKEEIIEAAKGIVPDTFYFLLGKEAE